MEFLKQIALSIFLSCGLIIANFLDVNKTKTYCVYFKIYVYCKWTQLLPIAIFNGVFGQFEQSG